MSSPRFWIALCIFALAVVPAAGQESDGEAKTIGWFNTTELSLTVTEGNSNTDSFGFKNVLTRAWERSKFVFKFDGVRSNTDDDRFLLAEPGITFLPGETPIIEIENTIVVDPPKEPDVEKYFVEGRYTKKLRGNRTWNGGASWDRNEDSGILNRFIAFGGVGNVWREGEKLHLETGYGASYTDRDEETPDPEKEQQFFGARLTVDVGYQFTKSTRLQYDLTGNLNLEDTNDYSLDSRGTVSVSINRLLSLAVSVQFLFNSEPALEDVDLLARVVLEDPDDIPGSGDEFFRTVESGGAEIFLREDRTRLEELDTVFRTSLVIDF
jgi:putative salt-induced outer membrane protein YdiY